VHLNRDQSREAMLCDQLISTTEIAYQVPADTVRACHQQIDEVVDHDGDVGTVDRLKRYHPLSGTKHLLHATEHVSQPLPRCSGVIPEHWPSRPFCYLVTEVYGLAGLAAPLPEHPENSETVERERDSQRGDSCGRADDETAT
jgi:hypothetical protein